MNKLIVALLLSIKTLCASQAQSVNAYERWDNAPKSLIVRLKSDQQLKEWRGQLQELDVAELAAASSVLQEDRIQGRVRYGDWQAVNLAMKNRELALAQKMNDNGNKKFIAQITEEINAAINAQKLNEIVLKALNRSRSQDADTVVREVLAELES